MPIRPLASINQFRFCTNPANNSSKDDNISNLHENHRIRQNEQFDDIIEGRLPHMKNVLHPKVAETIESAREMYATEDRSEV